MSLLLRDLPPTPLGHDKEAYPDPTGQLEDRRAPTPPPPHTPTHQPRPSPSPGDPRGGRERVYGGFPIHWRPLAIQYRVGQDYEVSRRPVPCRVPFCGPVDPPSSGRHRSGLPPGSRVVCSPHGSATEGEWNFQGLRAPRPELVEGKEKPVRLPGEEEQSRRRPSPQPTH